MCEAGSSHGISSRRCRPSLHKWMVAETSPQSGSLQDVNCSVDATLAKQLAVSFVPHPSWPSECDAKLPRLGFSLNGLGPSCRAQQAMPAIRP